jgi:regulator of sirC expression with transglutaminase-like and TPR domain
MARTSILLALLVVFPLRADDKSVEQLAEKVRKSVVVVTTPGRDEKRSGLGTGFVVGEGLIATNYHVIGEGRAISIETGDGKKHEATAVHAFDRVLDLAIIRVNVKDLPVLTLADSDKLKEGQTLVAVGNPHGLKNSVVSGVLSGKRDIEGRSMLQLAMPVERGNSGGPVVDRDGKVIGVITMKSAVTENLGFAVAINSLKPLLTKPNPVPMSAWKTIGALDTDDWEPKLGARWRQRAGRILVDEPGTGFGGRSYCVWKQATPKLPFEVSVTVKLDDEAGAAGLIFHNNDDGQHYGFYPSGGGLRLTRFDGSDVYSWKILEQTRSDAYKPGEWNTIKVRLEKGKILCYVNDKLAIESEDTGLTEGKVGLAKFRTTKAEFKQFRVGAKLTTAKPDGEMSARILKEINALKTPSPEALQKLGREGAAGLEIIRRRAKELEEQAVRLRRLAANVHTSAVVEQLTKAIKEKDKIDLIHAALLIAKLDNEELDTDTYRQDVERMVKKIAGKLPKDADEKAKLKALNDYLFNERGFHGSRGDYYNRSNSYLNEVLDDREGLPITLSVLYMELGKRLGLKIEGVGLPVHFVVRHVPAKGEAQLIDPYEGGKSLSREDAEKKVMELTGRKLDPGALKAVTSKAIVVRMLNNLLRLAQDERDLDGTMRYLDAIIGVDPDASGRERVLRGLGRAQQGDKTAALADIDWVLDKMPDDVDLEAVRAVRRRIDEGK